MSAVSERCPPPSGFSSNRGHLSRRQDGLTRASQQHEGTEPPPAYDHDCGSYPAWQGDERQVQAEVCAPPRGPPPPHAEPDPPPYDPWLAVPDNALLPPPPALREERSPAANASYDDAARGHAWCRANPIWNPRRHNQETLARSQAGQIHLTSPPRSQHVTIGCGRQRLTHVKTTAACADTILLSDVPLFIPSAATSPPNHQAKTIYFELHVTHMGSSGEGDAGIAIGFLAPPYPSWRLPGWHRASLGVHGDDGRRYVDDSWGGRSFVHPFRPGDVVGLGMKFGSRIEVFLTRNGRGEAGWDLHEERDSQAEEGDVFGLEGKHDLLAAVGVFGDVEFEVCFERNGWMFRP